MGTISRMVASQASRGHTTAGFNSSGYRSSGGGGSSSGGSSSGGGSSGSSSSSSGNYYTSPSGQVVQISSRSTDADRASLVAAGYTLGGSGSSGGSGSGGEMTAADIIKASRAQAAITGGNPNTIAGQIASGVVTNKGTGGFTTQTIGQSQPSSFQYRYVPVTQDSSDTGRRGLIESGGFSITNVFSSLSNKPAATQATKQEIQYDALGQGVSSQYDLSSANNTFANMANNPFGSVAVKQPSSKSASSSAPSQDFITMATAPFGFSTKSSQAAKPTGYVPPKLGEGEIYVTPEDIKYAELPKSFTDQLGISTGYKPITQDDIIISKYDPNSPFYTPEIRLPRPENVNLFTQDFPKYEGFWGKFASVYRSDLQNKELEADVLAKADYLAGKTGYRQNQEAMYYSAASIMGGDWAKGQVQDLISQADAGGDKATVNYWKNFLKNLNTTDKGIQSSSQDLMVGYTTVTGQLKPVQESLIALKPKMESGEYTDTDLATWNVYASQEASLLKQQQDYVDKLNANKLKADITLKNIKFLETKAGEQVSDINRIYESAGAALKEIPRLNYLTNLSENAKKESWAKSFTINLPIGVVNSIIDTGQIVNAPIRKAKEDISRGNYQAATMALVNPGSAVAREIYDYTRPDLYKDFSDVNWRGVSGTVNVGLMGFSFIKGLTTASISSGTALTSSVGKKYGIDWVKMGIQSPTGKTAKDYLFTGLKIGGVGAIAGAMPAFNYFTGKNTLSESVGEFGVNLGYMGGSAAAIAGAGYAGAWVKQNALQTDLQRALKDANIKTDFVGKQTDGTTRLVQGSKAKPIKVGDYKFEVQSFGDTTITQRTYMDSPIITTKTSVSEFPYITVSKGGKFVTTLKGGQVAQITTGDIMAVKGGTQIRDIGYSFVQSPSGQLTYSGVRGTSTVSSSMPYKYSGTIEIGKQAGTSKNFLFTLTNRVTKASTSGVDFIDDAFSSKLNLKNLFKTSGKVSVVDDSVKGIFTSKSMPTATIKIAPSKFIFSGKKAQMSFTGDTSSQFDDILGTNFRGNYQPEVTSPTTTIISPKVAYAYPNIGGTVKAGLAGISIPIAYQSTRLGIAVIPSLLAGIQTSSKAVGISQIGSKPISSLLSGSQPMVNAGTQYGADVYASVLPVSDVGTSTIGDVGSGSLYQPISAIGTPATPTISVPIVPPIIPIGGFWFPGLTGINIPSSKVKKGSKAKRSYKYMPSLKILALASSYTKKYKGKKLKTKLGKISTSVYDDMMLTGLEDRYLPTGKRRK